jgi:hypothetical protein
MHREEVRPEEASASGASTSEPTPGAHPWIDATSFKDGDVYAVYCENSESVPAEFRGKFNIGISIRGIFVRLREHITGCKTKLHAMATWMQDLILAGIISKEGGQWKHPLLTITTLACSRLGGKTLAELECQFISLMRAIYGDKVLNSTRGGEGCKHCTFTKEGAEFFRVLVSCRLQSARAWLRADQRPDLDVHQVSYLPIRVMCGKILGTFCVNKFLRNVWSLEGWVQVDGGSLIMTI